MRDDESKKWEWSDPLPRTARRYTIHGLEPGTYAFGVAVYDETYSGDTEEGSVFSGVYYFTISQDAVATTTPTTTTTTIPCPTEETIVVEVASWSYRQKLIDPNKPYTKQMFKVEAVYQISNPAPYPASVSFSSRATADVIGKDLRTINRATPVEVPALSVVTLANSTTVYSNDPSLIGVELGEVSTSYDCSVSPTLVPPSTTTTTTIPCPSSGLLSEEAADKLVWDVEWSAVATGATNEYTLTGAVTITNPTPVDAVVRFEIHLFNSAGAWWGFFYGLTDVQLAAGEVWTRDVEGYKRANSSDGPNFETHFRNLSVWFYC
jgi:hypothetical protein